MTAPWYIGAYIEHKLLNKFPNDKIGRSSQPEVFLGKGVLQLCSKWTGKHPCRSAISIKLLCSFIEIIPLCGFSPVNLLHIFRTPFPRNTSRWLLLSVTTNHSSNHIIKHDLDFSSLFWIVLLSALRDFIDIIRVLSESIGVLETFQTNVLSLLDLKCNCHNRNRRNVTVIGQSSVIMIAD